jgi:3'-phosphoadenosine 5'-phosphosulfate sulfotransferase (PAPS reductase)/FAD synthetase
MKNKVRHVLGISGGKDSAALSIYLKDKYPVLDLDYYFTDTGKELEETYALIKNLESNLGKKVNHLESAKKSNEDPFDHYYKLFGGYLPSSNARWCTKKLKLEPFENYVGNDYVISYVGIRGDEDREGYISKKPNIQSIFPFRRNIWSEDVIAKVLNNNNINLLLTYYSENAEASKMARIVEIVNEPLSAKFIQSQKLNALLDLGVKEFNAVVYKYIKEKTDYPLAHTDNFPLIDNEDNLIREDIFKILGESGVGVPAYYEKVKFEIDGKTGEYARSRSGCYFCFFQQKIEWVWLLENHPDKFKLATQYENEKEGFTWNQHESLKELAEPKRIAQIKREFLNRKNKEKSAKSPYLVDILDDTESSSCIACFI